MIYQGSKARLIKDILPYIQNCIDSNKVNLYIEPFVGGANVIQHIKRATKLTMKEQNNNRRNNHLITYKGKTQTMKQWSEELNIPYFCLSKRLSKLHLSVEEAFMSSDRRFKGGKKCQK